MREELILIRERPGLYLSSHNESFTALCGFIVGYQTGFWAGKKHCASTATDALLLPPEFNRFVTEYYGRDYPDGGKGWQDFIREQTDSDQTAFHLFFRLLEDYDRSKVVVDQA